MLRVGRDRAWCSDASLAKTGPRLLPPLPCTLGSEHAMNSLVKLLGPEKQSIYTRIRGCYDRVRPEGVPPLSDVMNEGEIPKTCEHRVCR